MNLPRHSPSSLNLFCASPSMFVLERVIGHRQPVGVPAHRGTAIEAGIAAGLLDLDLPVAECVDVATSTYNRLSALSGDPRREIYGQSIKDMVTTGLEELRPYGKPSRTQGFVEWRPEGLQSPIVGYFDFEWADHGIIVDLKTTEKLPSQIKVPHARQVALYAAAISDNIDARLTYVTPKKRATYRLENVHQHRAALHRIALAVERFLSLSDDPEFFLTITAPDVESFYWTSPESRHLAFQHWRI
jgi:hypothetical protein